MNKSGGIQTGLAGCERRKLPPDAEADNVRSAESVSLSKGSDAVVHVAIHADHDRLLQSLFFSGHEW